jgi:hypothetical protein
MNDWRCPFCACRILPVNKITPPTKPRDRDEQSSARGDLEVLVRAKVGASGRQATYEVVVRAAAEKAQIACVVRPLC